MKRIVVMVLRNILLVPFWMIKLMFYAESSKISVEKKFKFLKFITKKANSSGKVKIISSGFENIPKKQGYIMFPNHQGLYDVLAFMDVHPYPFSVVMKKEVEKIPVLNYVFKCLKAHALDREDIRKSMKVILEVTKEVQEGKNFIIFPEGTRTRNGNKTLEFKGGSFKAAMNAKVPIIPVALIDSYKPFDSNSIKKTIVQIHYLKPLYYEDYKNMKSVEIANYVKSAIDRKINELDK